MERTTSMTGTFLDRRATPRVTVAGGHQFGLPLSLTVQVLEVSQSGVLLLAHEDMEVGRRARLRAVLGGSPLDVEIEVRRSGWDARGAVGTGGYQIGAAFVSLDDHSRRSIQRFLSNHGDSGGGSTEREEVQ